MTVEFPAEILGAAVVAGLVSHDAGGWQITEKGVEVWREWAAQQ